MQLYCRMAGIVYCLLNNLQSDYLSHSTVTVFLLINISEGVHTFFFAIKLTEVNWKETISYVTF